MKIQITNKTFKDYLRLVIVAISLIFILIIINFHNNYKKSEIIYFEKILKNTYLNKTLETVVENFNPRY